MAQARGGRRNALQRASRVTASVALALMVQGSVPVATTERMFPSFLRDGDLVFRMGRGMLSALWGRLGNNFVPYSHVGLLVTSDGLPYVVHTEADEFTGIGYARKEPLAVFLGSSSADSGAVFRSTGLVSETDRNLVARTAEDYAHRKIPFDTDFDLDTEDRLYCTELVWRAFKSVGIDLAPQRDFLSSVAFLGGRPREIISLNNVLESGSVVFLTEIH
jgi:hypothetical protein